MYKLRNKKGFTLIEMMAVIAIIAILVSIVTPLVTDSRDKAKAATNAANLRTVEAQLANLLVTNPEAFDTAEAEAGEFLNDLNAKVAEWNGKLAAATSDYQQKDAEARAKQAEVDAVVNAMTPEERQVFDNYKNSSGFMKGVYAAQLAITHPNLAAMEGERVLLKEYAAVAEITCMEIVPVVDSLTKQLDVVTHRMECTFYAHDGVLTLANGFSIAAPKSQELKTGGLTMEKDIDMIVVVSDSEIYASYEGLTKECFAVAATDINAKLTDFSHSYRDADGNEKCDICAGAYEHTDADKWANDYDQGQIGGNN